VFKKNLIKKGGEITIAVDKEKVYWGKSLAVQDFRFYGLRDYGRPGRDMKVGMMPPKLAQAMINLSGARKGETIMDPFCGTGVVPQEALLAGFKAIGADKSKETLALAKLNMEWLDKELQKKSKRLLKEKTDLELFHADAADIEKFVGKKPISAIVTEGTLGPKYGRVSPSSIEMNNNFKTLENLYIAAFKAFKNILKNNGKVVITFPAYMLKKGKGAVFSPFIDKITEIGYNIIHPLNGEKMPENAEISLSKRGTILYFRPDQNVGREIVIFEKT
jgi:tRNA G10  N-methylase Trm11